MRIHLAIRDYDNSGRFVDYYNDYEIVLTDEDINEFKQLTCIDDTINALAEDIFTQLSPHLKAALMTVIYNQDYQRKK